MLPKKKALKLDEKQESSNFEIGTYQTLSF
jgi:hypothetical protein